VVTTPLTPVEGRVLACLIEKQRTVPDQYPLTLLALVGACNQTTSREPVMQLTEHEVESAVRSLKAAGLVRLVHPTHGRGVTRHRHVADEAWQLDEDDAAAPALLAVLSVLMLRGPQTVSELRTRTERQHPFASLEEVEQALARLASLGMAHRLDRRPGQTQLRWQQLVADEPAEHAAHDQHEVRQVTEAGEVRAEPGGESGVPGEVAELRARIAELDARVARLEAAIADLL